MGDDTVSLVRGQRVGGHVGGNEPPNPIPLIATIVVWRFDEVFLFFTIRLAFRSVAVGNQLYLVGHIQIGNLARRVAVSAVMGKQEVALDESRRDERYLSRRYAPPGWSRRDCVGGSRYADDGILESKVSCGRKPKEGSLYSNAWFLSRE